MHTCTHTYVIHTRFFKWVQLRGSMCLACAKALGSTLSSEEEKETNRTASVVRGVALPSSKSSTGSGHSASPRRTHSSVTPPWSQNEAESHNSNAAETSTVDFPAPSIVKSKLIWSMGSQPVVFSFRRTSELRQR